MHWRRQWKPTPVFLPGESQGRGSLVGCRLWGRTESDTTEATYQQQQQRALCVCVSLSLSLFFPPLLPSEHIGRRWLFAIEPSPRIKSASTLNMNITASTTVRNKYLSHKPPVCSILLWQSVLRQYPLTLEILYYLHVICNLITPPKGAT